MSLLQALGTSSLWLSLASSLATLCFQGNNGISIIKTKQYYSPMWLSVLMLSPKCIKEFTFYTSKREFIWNWSGRGYLFVMWFCGSSKHWWSNATSILPGRQGPEKRVQRLYSSFRGRLGWLGNHRTRSRQVRSGVTWSWTLIICFFFTEMWKSINICSFKPSTEECFLIAILGHPGDPFNSTKPIKTQNNRKGNHFQREKSPEKEKHHRNSSNSPSASLGEFEVITVMSKIPGLTRLSRRHGIKMCGRRVGAAGGHCNDRRKKLFKTQTSRAGSKGRDTESTEKTWAELVMW